MQPTQNFKVNMNIMLNRKIIEGIIFRVNVLPAYPLKHHDIVTKMNQFNTDMDTRFNPIKASKIPINVI